jgi:molecular chaperone GrpE
MPTEENGKASPAEGDAPLPEVDLSEAAASADVDEEGAPGAPDIDLPTAIAQRDEYLALAKRVQADFENYKKRTTRLAAEQASIAAGRIVEALLPVLDACDAAIIHGVEGVGPIHKALFDELAKHGLELVPTDDVPFDPNQHEAVMHEPGDGGEPHIVEVLRTGYRWQGRVLRAAMVKVKD